MDDTFHLSFVHARAGPYGGGKKRPYLLGHQASHPQWRSFQRGLPIQMDSAIELHQRAGVRLGPCGADELKQFALALPEYTLVVVDANQAYACFAYGRSAQLQGSYMKMAVMMP